MTPCYQSRGKAGDASTFLLSVALKSRILSAFLALCLLVVGRHWGGPTSHPGGVSPCSQCCSASITGAGCPLHPCRCSSQQWSWLRSSLLPCWGAGGFFFFHYYCSFLSFLIFAESTKTVMIYLLARRAEACRQQQISGGTRVHLEQGHGHRTLPAEGCCTWGLCLPTG